MDSIVIEELGHFKNILQEKRVVFKGKLSLCSLDTYKKICEIAGGTASETFYEDKTDYIVFAKHTYDKYLRGDYSEKMKKAIHLAQEGKLEILSEEAFFELIGISVPNQKEKDCVKNTESNVRPSSRDIDDSNPFFGKHFIITGSLKKFERALAYECITFFGGFEDKSVSKITDYVIVGTFDPAHIKDEKSGKLKRAEEYIDKGLGIQIIDEYKFYDMLEEAQTPKNTSIISINDVNKILHIIQDRFSVLFPGTNIRNYIQTNILKGEKAISVIFLDNKLMMKFVFLKNTCRLLIGANYKNVIPKELEAYTMPSYSGFICIDAEDISLLKSFDDFYKKFYEDCSSKDIGCCSHYEDCSDAGHCVNTNIETVISCAYRQNLNAGKIFYGKNKNI